MKSYVVSYDLIKRKNYPDLINALQAFNYWHCLGSTWVVKSDATAVQVRDSLLRHIDADDRLIVATLTGEAAWTSSFSQQCSQWLTDNL